MTTTDPATGWIRCIEPEDIPADIADCALHAASGAAVALDIPWALTVFFFEACDADHPDAVGPLKGPPQGVAHMGGRTALTRRTERILVRAGLPLELTQHIVCHEVRHVFQGWRGWHELAYAELWDDLEADAEEWANSFLEQR